jgi:dipeptidyl aminopeptidase/acylaminoacyl peptidase
VSIEPHRAWIASIAALSMSLAACQATASVPQASASDPIAVSGRSPTPSASVTATTSPQPVDYSALHGRILMEHLGNAVDGSDMPTDDYHPQRRRLYWMDPATMTGATAAELLPGSPSTGKLNADVSADGTRVVFMDTSSRSRIWIAYLDGTGLQQVSAKCACSELDPAFDPTGKRIVYVHLDGATRPETHGANGHLDVSGKGESWLAIRDLETGTITKLDATVGPSSDAVPEQPSWSPNGREIVFNRTTWGTGDIPASGSLQVVNVETGKVRTLPTDARWPVPGDADWSRDGSTIVYTSYPISSTGSIPDVPAGGILTITRDGTDNRWIHSGAGASFMPDDRLVFQDNVFWVMRADGSDARPVNIRADDLSELEVGFAYIAHWVGMP